MALCTVQAVPCIPCNQRALAKCHALVSTRTSLFLKQAPSSPSAYGLRSRILYYTNLFPRATTSDETSNGANQYAGDKRDGVVTLEEVPSVEKNVYSESVTTTEVPREESPLDEQTNELWDNLNIKFDSENAYSIILYASGALVALWLVSAIVGAIESIPLFPQLMEVVGLGYTFWFTSRYLLFKKNREELAAKIEELKQQVLGSNAE